MRTMTKFLAGAAGLAAIATAAPAAAQYYPYGYSGYAYPAYGYNAYNYGVNPNVAAQQCTAAVQSRLYNRTSLAEIIGSLVGIPNNQGRVLSITQTRPTRSGRRGGGVPTSRPPARAKRTWMERPRSLRKSPRSPRWWPSR